MHDPLKVCLNRSLELPSVTLRFRDWPGLAGPIVHFAAPGSTLAVELAGAFAPRVRVLSVLAREDMPYQVDAADLREFLRVFGFPGPLLVGDGVGAIAPLLVAAWWPEAVGALLLIAPRREGRGARECPPDWDALLAMVRCPVRVSPAWSATEAEALLGTAG